MTIVRTFEAKGWTAADYDRLMDEPDRPARARAGPFGARGLVPLGGRDRRRHAGGRRVRVTCRGRPARRRDDRADRRRAGAPAPRDQRARGAQRAFGLTAARGQGMRTGIVRGPAHLAGRPRDRAGVGQLELGVARHPLLERDPQLHAGEVRARGSGGCRDRTRRGGSRPGRSPPGRRRGTRSGSRLAAGNGSSTQSPSCIGQPSNSKSFGDQARHRDRRVRAQELLDRGGHQRRFRREALAGRRGAARGARATRRSPTRSCRCRRPSAAPSCRARGRGGACCRRARLRAGTS